METMSENYMSWIWTCTDHLSTMDQTLVLSAKKNHFLFNHRVQEIPEERVQ